jgi:hypothetical protein
MRPVLLKQMNLVAVLLLLLGAAECGAVVAVNAIIATLL